MRALAALLLLPAALAAQAKDPVPIDIAVEGDTLHGRFFEAEGATPTPTILLIPGWPGNPDDVLGVCRLLSAGGVNVLMFNPRGMHASTGVTTFAGALEDVGTVFEWLLAPEQLRRFHVDTTRLALGGHSFGGAMTISYAARDARARRLVSIAGGDHAVHVRQMDADTAFARAFRQMLLSTQAPRGPVRFDLEGTMAELRAGIGTYGTLGHAGRLADRAILLVGGWDDVGAPIEHHLVPLYRELRAAGARDVTVVAFHDGHNFTRSRPEVAAAIREWLFRPAAPVTNAAPAERR